MQFPLPCPRRWIVALAVIALAGAPGAGLSAQSLASSRLRIDTAGTSGPSGGLDRLSAAVADSVRRSPTPWVLGGALLGAGVGAAATKAFSDSFCPESRPGYTCSGTSTAEGALIGAALGAFAGWVTWSMLPKVPATRR